MPPASSPAKRGFAARAGKPLVFVACLAPALRLAGDAYFEKLGANPIAELLNRLGFWGLTFLVLSLSISPMKMVFGWTFPMRVRRMVGLFSFWYLAMHFATYVALDQGFDLGDITRDIVKRKFITVGFAAFLLLVPLAVTSTDRMVKALGFRRWKQLHRLAYVAAVLGVIHFVWRVKADLLVPSIFAVVLLTLFLVRLWSAPRDKRDKRDKKKQERSAQGAF